MAVEDGAPASGKMYSLTEVKQHNTEEDCWIVVHGKVCCNTCPKPYDRSTVCCISTELKDCYWVSAHVSAVNAAGLQCHRVLGRASRRF